MFLTLSDPAKVLPIRPLKRDLVSVGKRRHHFGGFGSKDNGARFPLTTSGDHVQVARKRGRTPRVAHPSILSSLAALGTRFLDDGSYAKRGFCAQCRHTQVHGGDTGNANGDRDPLGNL